MKMRIALLASVTMLPCLTNAALGEGNPYPDAKPIFVSLPPHAQTVRHSPSAQLVQWNGGFIDLTGRPIHFTMIGTDPRKTNTTTTVPVVIVPIKMVYGKTNGNMTFDPNTDKAVNGSNNTVTADVVASPLFDSGVNFTQGGTNLGTTQYIDAFQRGNFWRPISNGGGGYHVLLGQPTVLTEQTINVTSAQGSVIQNPFGTNKVGTMDFNSFDNALRGFIGKFSQINPGVLPIFITDNVFLTQQGCCIGGYHSANGVQPGGQTYSYTTYVTFAGSFSQDVSVLSAEIGEWLDDPFADNIVNCNNSSMLEVGGPPEQEKNYGAYPYVLNGATYNLQSLVFLEYFGDRRRFSVDKWFSFQNDLRNVCPGQ